MKKFVLAAVAASLVSTSAFAAPFDGGRHDDRGRVEQSQRPDVRVNVRSDMRHDARFDNRNDVRRDDHRFGQNFHRPQQQQMRHDWKRGQRFDARYARNYRVIGNPYAYRLHSAPRGYRWVQSGNDAVLVGIASGLIASVMMNAVR